MKSVKLSKKTLPLLRVLMHKKGLDLFSPESGISDGPNFVGQTKALAEEMAEAHQKLLKHKVKINAKFKDIGKNALRRVVVPARSLWSDFDEDPEIISELWERRDEVPSCSGILICANPDLHTQYLYRIRNKRLSVEVDTFAWVGDFLVHYSACAWDKGSMSKTPDGRLIGDFGHADESVDFYEIEARHTGKAHRLGWTMQKVVGYALYQELYGCVDHLTMGGGTKKRLELEGIEYTNSLKKIILIQTPEDDIED